MEFSVKSGSPEKQRSACIVVGVFESCRLSPITEQLDKISKGYISTLLCRGELEGKVGQTLLLHYVPNVLSERIPLISCGKERELVDGYGKTTTARVIGEQQMKELGMNAYLDGFHFYNGDKNGQMEAHHYVTVLNEEVMQVVIYDSNTCDARLMGVKYIISERLFQQLPMEEKKLWHNHQYEIKSDTLITSGLPAQAERALMAKIVNTYGKTWHTDRDNTLPLYDGLHRRRSIGSSVADRPRSPFWRRHAKNPPATPRYHHSPRTGSLDAEARPIVLVGKGLTFDAGGISIKPADSMDEMKYDMCSAVTVYGVMRMAVELNLPLNIVGVLTGCENMVDCHAFRPGDVLTTLSDQTEEVLNTDAESRLVLCYALPYVERFNPNMVIDVAILAQPRRTQR